MSLSPPPIREGVQDKGDLFSKTWQGWFNEIFDYLRGIGRIGSVTLTVSVATTTVTAPNCNSGSSIILFPVTANAGTEFGAGSLYVVAGKGSFVIHHVNSGTTLRTFKYVISG